MVGSGIYGGSDCHGLVGLDVRLGAGACRWNSPCVDAFIWAVHVWGLARRASCALAGSGGYGSDPFKRNWRRG